MCRELIFTEYAKKYRGQIVQRCPAVIFFIKLFWVHPSQPSQCKSLTGLWIYALKWTFNLFLFFIFWLAAGSAVMEAGAEYGIKIHSWDHTWMLWIPWDSRTWLCSFSNRSQLVDKDIAILDDVLRSIYCTVLGLEKIILAYKGLMLCHPLSNLWGTNGIFLIIQKHAKLNFFFPPYSRVL